MLLRNSSIDKTSRRSNRAAARRNADRHFSMEPLEDRLLLAVVWTNRGTPATDTDAFNATYGVNATVAREIIDHAIDDWNNVIQDFNYDGDDDPTTNNIYQLTVSAADLGGGFRGLANGFNVVGGLPTAATVTMDDAGGSGGWFFDTTITDDDEFTTIVNPFQADSAEAGNDFYRTALHEIGHTMGILTGAGLAINGFLTPAGTDQVDGVADLNTFQNLAGQFGVLATLTDNGGGHFYEGPVDPAFPGAPTHPDELMDPGRTVGPPATRQLITDLDAQVLADAYGYRVTLPSELNVFIEPDALESNNTLETATVLGSLEQVTVQDLSIFESGDEDFFRITAAHTGKLIVNSLFIHSPGNDIDMRIRDGDGNQIASSTSLTDNELIVIPVVSQESYYVQVFGFAGSINNYNLEIENYAAPVPNAVWLDPADDTGMMNNDNVTSEDEARIFIEADLQDFADMGIDILTPAEVTSGEDGAAVVVIVNGVELGTATPIAGTNNTLFEYTFDPGDLSTTLIPTGGGGGLNAVKGAVRMYDGQDDQQDARSEESEPLLVTLDQTAPNVEPPNLLPSSDTGMNPTDNVTNKMQPAFFGFAEPNAKVRILANDFVVGEGVATSQGTWEITVEPLRDGQYTIAALAEDLAGNTTISEVLEEGLIVDTVEPNTPLLDLLNDNGHSDTDNITSANLLNFLMVGSDTTDGNGNPFPNDVKYRLYWRPGDGTGEVLVYDSFVEFGGFTAMGELNRIVSQDLNDAIGTPFPDGVQNFKLEVEDRAGNISHDFILNVEIDNTAPLLATIDLIDSSDSGMDETDDVTNKMEPAFNGVSEIEATVTLYAQEVNAAGVIIGNNFIVGTGFVGSDLTDGIPDNGLGTWEITSEPLDEGSYLMTAVIEDWAGNSAVTDPLRIWVDTVEPNTPYLDLLNDTGHSDTDNITSANLLDFLMVGDDTVFGNGNPFPNDVKYRLYWRAGDGNGEVLVYDSFAEFGDFTIMGEINRIVSQDLNDAIGTPFPDGVHNFKLEIEDRAGNISHDFLLPVEIDNTRPIATIDLIDSSDSGMINNDNVTNKMEPAFNGISEVEATVTLYAQAVDEDGDPIGDNYVVGTGFVGSDLTDGEPGDGLGTWEITSEPLDDGSYLITALVEDWAGNFDITDPLRIWIDTIKPNTPRLDLVSNSDSGRSDTDNITNDVRPTMTLNANDTIDGDGNLLPNGLKYRLYVRPDGDLSVPEILVIDSFAELGTFTTDNIFTHIVTLGLNDPLGPAFPDGIHNFKLEIEDRAGNISDHFLLDVEFDTVAPVKFFGEPGIADDGLHPESDSGIPGQPGTLDDRITNDATPTFWGRAEADSIIVARLANGTFLSETVALPFDGNDAFPGGRWQLTSGVDLTTAGLGANGGLRQIVITGEDVAGNISAEMDLNIFVDVVGPRVQNVRVTDEPQYALFDPKPSEDGPSPLVNSLTVTLTDLPFRDLAFLYSAANEILVEQGGNFDVFGDHVGQVVIESIVVVEEEIGVGEGELATMVVQINFAEPLPDDRYTFVISDRISDDAGNALDGDHLTADPRGGGAFPSGDGLVGGDFVARFTIDSRPEIGTWSGGSVYIDANGNSFFDPENRDDVNEDLVFEYAYPSDDVFNGNFAENRLGVADGFDKLAAYGDASQPSNSTGFRWKIDFDNDGVPDLLVFDSANINGLPFAGRFDNNDINGDEVGIFTGNTWYFDTNHDFNVDINLQSQLRGYPISGDFDGDGFDDLGTYNEQLDRFEFDLTDGVRRGFNGTIDALVYTGFAGVRERPVAADMDADGFDDFGLWVPDRSGVTPEESGEWYIFVSGGNSLLNRIELDPQFNNPTIFFEPDPFGDDYFAQFGDQFALPLLGNFDPPATIVASASLTNVDNPLDVNADNQISPLDALMVINELNGMDAPNGAHYPDTNADGAVSPHDAILVINALDQSLNLRSATGTDSPVPAVDALALSAPHEDQEDSSWDDVIGHLAVDWLGFTPDNA